MANSVVLSAAGPGERRRARILAILNAAIFFFAGLPFLIIDTWAWLVHDAPHGAYNALTSLAFCAALAITWVINRRGRITLAAILHLTFMSVGLVAFFLYTDPQMMNLLFVEPVIVAAFVLRPWASFPLAAVSASSFAALNFLHGGTLGVDLQMAGGLLGVAIISWVAASYLEWTAAALHTTAADLELGRAAHHKAQEERRQVEAALAAAEQQSRTLFEKSPVGIMLFDRDLVITECNERFAALVHSSRDRMVGTDYGRTGDQRARAAMEEALRGNTGSFEGSTKGQKGSRGRWISFTASPLLGPLNQVIGGIGVLSDLTDKKQAEELVERLAFYDRLTGLANRRLLLDRLEQAIERSSRTGHRVTVAVLDIDHFRNVNDTIGPAAADALLKAVVSRLEPIIRRGDTLARIGGDQFGLLISQAEGFSAVASMAERIQGAFRDPWTIGDTTVQATASLGFASYSDDTRGAQNLLDNADVAMRRAKTLGRDTCQFFDPTMNVEVAERLQMEREFRVALSDEQLCVYYQPQIDLRDGLIAGAEALVRWSHPERGIILPAGFVPLAEETGLISRLDSWVVAVACREAVSWKAAGGRSLRLAVNVSPLHLHSPDLLPTVAAALTASGLAAADLEVELTETAIVADALLATQILGELRDLGVAVALDDFGTGYSSLSHLQELPITTVKVDRSFVSRVDTDAGAAAIVKAVIELSHSLGLQVIAEGIESDGQLRLLQAMGCDVGQGFLFAQPLPASEFRALLETQDTFEGIVVPGLRARPPAKLRIAGGRARAPGAAGYSASGSSR